MTSSISTSAPVSDRPILLLADDSVTIQRVIELTFANEDIQVIAVGDGDHAIATLRHSPPDIVLADVGMPGKNGYELARHVKQTPGLSHVPVLLLTGAFEPVDQVQAREAGCDGVLVKPFEPQAVIQRVKELLAASAPAPAAVSSVAPPAEAPAAAPGQDVPGPVMAAAEPARSADTAALDDYFDRLNQAFSQRISAPAAVPAPAVVVETERQVETTAERPAAPDAPVLAGAFTALLAAEQAESESAPDPFAEWLPEAPVAQAPVAAVTDEVIDEIVRRVLAQMSDRVVRETVATLASEATEKLVREEIERIKSHIK